MTAFSDFVLAYDTWKNNKDLQITPQNRAEYGWKIGAKAREEFQHHLDNLEEGLFDKETMERFKNMFNKGNELLGINVISNPVGTNSDKVYLYHVKPYSRQSFVKDVAFKKSTHLYTKPLLKDPLGGSFYWKYGVKPNGVIIKDSVNVYVDEAGKEDVGTFVGEDKGVSVSGSVNYVDGTVSINRVSDNNAVNSEINERIASAIIKAYNESQKNKDGSNGSGGSSSSSSGSSSGVSIFSIFEDLFPKENSSATGENVKTCPYYYLDRDDFEFNYTVFGEPVKILWQYDITNKGE